MGRKGKHDREAGSSSERRREPASPSPPRRAPAPPAFSIAPTSASEHDRHYIRASVCRRYWETRTPLPWSDVHLPNNCHLSADRVPIPPVPTSGRARDTEIERRRRLLPDDLFYDPRYAPDSGLWDTWFHDEHDTRRASLFAGTSTGPRRPRQERAAPAPQERGLGRPGGDHGPLCRRGRRLPGAVDGGRRGGGDGGGPAGRVLAAAGPGVGLVLHCSGDGRRRGRELVPALPRSPEREASPREEVVQAPPAVQPAPVYHAPPAHLWTPPAYIDLVSDDDDTGGQ
ncbi:hypothetical protein VPH35_064661 [Triticum aestivum]